MRTRLPPVALLAAGLALAQVPTTWRSGNGAWNDAARWTAGLPNPFASADVRGDSQITVPSGIWVSGDLRIGTHAGDRARVQVDGGSVILVQDSLFVGEDSGGQGEFVLNSGALHSVMDVFVGAATASTGRANDAILRIRGGSFLGRTLSVGFGFGSHALLAVEGSQASAVHVLDYVYLQATADPTGRPGLTTLSFTLDEHGVTPITIQSKLRGLRITPDAASRCRLEIALRAVPPREDITLVSSHAPTIGTFEGLPKAARSLLEFAGKTYRWALTYRGGANRTRSRSAEPYHVGRSRAPHSRTLHPATARASVARASHLSTRHLRGQTGFPRRGRLRRLQPRRRRWPHDVCGQPGRFRPREPARGGGSRWTPRRGVPRGRRHRPRHPLQIRHPFLTLDAQGAPGEGIVLRNHGIYVRTHDVVLRYFRIRLGDEGVRAGACDYEAGEGLDGIRFVDGAKDCIADHLSLSWTTGKIITITGMSDRITIQWCILSESLNFAGHGYASWPTATA